MAVNLFEGGRRIAKLLSIIWVVGVVAIAAFIYKSIDPPSISIYFKANQSGEFERIPNKCPDEYFSTKHYKFSIKEEMHLLVRLCRHNRLKDTPSASVIIKPEKAELTKLLKKSDFQQWLIEQKNKLILIDVGIPTVLFLAGGLLVIWIFTWVIGWIVRGFMVIPRGKDKK